MSERKTKKLEEIVSRFIDYRGKTPTKTDSGVPLITAKIVKDGGLSPYTEYIADGSYNHWMTRGIPEKDDVIITTEAPLGEVALMPEGQVALAQRIIVMHTNPEECDSIYLKYFLQWKVGKQCVLNRQSGSTVFGIRSAELKKAQVSIHADIHEQKTIASLLYAIDKKIEVNRRINDNLEAMAQALYDYWFVQFDFPDENGRPYKSSGGKMVWNDKLKREIPAGWCAQPLFEVASVLYGYPFKTELFTDDASDLPVIRIRDIQENTFSAHSREPIHKKYLTQKGDLLIGMDGNFHLNYWHRDGDGVNQRVVRIRSCASTVSNIQLKLELTPYIKMREANVTRSTVGHLSDNDFKERYISVAAESLQFNPAKVLDALLDKMISLIAETQKLAKQRDFLLPLLMNGQVQVKPQGELNYHLSLRQVAGGRILPS